MLPILQYCSVCGAANPVESQQCFACQELLHTDEDNTLYTQHLHDQYKIVREVGTGGFGAVYQAEDLQRPGRKVAIKQIRISGLTAQQVIDATDTFNREVDLLSGLSHPHLPRIYDHFSDTNNWYLVMEFIEGETLEAYLEHCYQAGVKKAFSFDGILDIGIQLCDVLTYLHTRQPAIIFRDLKPGNIMRTLAGQLYLIDFGIARRFTPGKARDTMPLGSPGYAAPEQYGKAQTTAQADLYSLGALLHQLLTGDDPAQTPFQFKPQYLRGYASAGEEEMEKLIMQLVQREAFKRPDSARQVKQELEGIVLRHTTLQSPVRQKVRVPPPPMHTSSPLYTTKPYTPSQQPTAPQTQYGAQQQQQWAYNTPAQKKTVSRRNMLATIGLTGLAISFGTSMWANAQHSNRIQSSPGPGWENFHHEVKTYTGHNSPVLELRWPANSQSVMSMDQHTVLVWEPDSGHTQQEYSFNNVDLQNTLWSDDGGAFALLDANSIQIWNVVNQAPQYTYPQPAEISSLAAWSPNGKAIAALGNDNTLQVLNANTGEVFSRAKNFDQELTAIAWSPDSQFIVAGDIHNTLHISNAENGEKGQTFDESIKADSNQDQKATELQLVTWSPDNSSIASTTRQGVIRIVNTTTGAIITIDASYQEVVDVIAWSPDSKYLATAVRFQGVIIRNATTGNAEASFQNVPDIINALVWSPDSSMLAFAGQGNTVWTWKPPEINIES